MLTLSPINKDVQDTLNQKIAMMAKGESGKVYRDPKTTQWTSDPIINGSVSDSEKGSIVENYMFARSPWLRATSFTPIEENQPLILMGGELDSIGNLAGAFDTTAANVYKPTVYDMFHDRGARYIKGGKDTNVSMPYRPMPGIKEASIEYKGGGMKLGATRSAQISWTCWTWEELERLTPHFLAPRRTVLLEWGWSMKGIESGIYNLYDVNDGIQTFSPDKVNNLSQNLPQHILDQKGHYDAILGLIQNFEWSVNDQGGFDCTTNLISPGVTMLQTKGKAEDKYKNFASLPLYDVEGTGATENEASVWKETERLAPYLTYREYMRDLGSQIFHMSMERQKDGKIDFNAWTGKRASLPIISLDKFMIGGKAYMHNVNVLGDYHFVSWGWFEDNVLSRFFGQVNSNISDPDNPENSIDQRVISEFRSIEQSMDDYGMLETYKTYSDARKPDGTDGTLKWNDNKDGSWIKSAPKRGAPKLQSTRFRNSPYLITLDTSKWLIPNREDIVFGNPDFRWRPTIDSDENFFKEIYSPPEGADYMEIRNIFFNVGYLRDMSKKANDLTSVVTSIWDDFARDYGDVYKFKIEYDDVNKRMLLREEGYSHFKLDQYKESRELVESGGSPVGAQIFEFPIMEAGSIVKTNTINAKLPDRMQIAAMYGVRNLGENAEKNTKDYNELVGNSWGVISDDLANPLENEEEKKIKRHKDMMAGNIDYPSKMNRGFGRSDANLNKPLFVGTLDMEKVKNGQNQDAKEGTQIRPSIINNINESQKEYMAHITKVNLDSKKVEEYKAIEIMYLEAQLFRLEFGLEDKEKFLEKGLDWYEITDLSDVDFGTNDEKDEGSYSKSVSDYKKFNKGDQLKNLNTEKRYMKSIQNSNTAAGGSAATKENNSGHIHLKPMFRPELVKLIRGNAEGVLANINPLVPIDFEMEIDGTGGMFPGNAFHSSYLGERYRNETVFQMVGVNHTVDTSGWSTTIKGQIRTGEMPVIRDEDLTLKELADIKANRGKVEEQSAEAAAAQQAERDRVAGELEAARKKAEAKEIEELENELEKQKLADKEEADDKAAEAAKEAAQTATQTRIAQDAALGVGAADTLNNELGTGSTDANTVKRALEVYAGLSLEGQDAFNKQWNILRGDKTLVDAITSETWAPWRSWGQDDLVTLAQTGGATAARLIQFESMVPTDD